MSVCKNQIGSADGDLLSFELKKIWGIIMKINLSEYFAFLWDLLSTKFVLVVAGFKFEWYEFRMSTVVVGLSSWDRVMVRQATFCYLVQESCERTDLIVEITAETNLLQARRVVVVKAE